MMGAAGDYSIKDDCGPGRTCSCAPARDTGAQFCLRAGSARLNLARMLSIDACCQSMFAGLNDAIATRCGPERTADRQ